MTYKESCHKWIRSWYFCWPTLKYTDHYTGLIHPATSLYLPYTNRYTDCVRPEDGSLYRPFHAVLWPRRPLESLRAATIRQRVDVTHFYISSSKFFSPISAACRNKRKSIFCQWRGLAVCGRPPACQRFACFPLEENWKRKNGCSCHGCFLAPCRRSTWDK